MPSNAVWSGVPNSAEPFMAKLDMGLTGGGLILCGLGAFVGAETTVLVPARGGGLKPFAVIATLNVTEKTIVPTVNSDGTVTLTRTDTTNGATFNCWIFYR